MPIAQPGISRSRGGSDGGGLRSCRGHLRYTGMLPIYTIKHYQLKIPLRTSPSKHWGITNRIAKYIVLQVFRGRQCGQPQPSHRSGGNWGLDKLFAILRECGDVSTRSPCGGWYRCFAVGDGKGGFTRERRRVHVQARIRKRGGCGCGCRHRQPNSGGQMRGGVRGDLLSGWTWCDELRTVVFVEGSTTALRCG